MSTAEAISVVNNGMALAAHFGDGSVKAGDLASGFVGAVDQGPRAGSGGVAGIYGDGAEGTGGWKDLYRACRETI